MGHRENDSTVGRGLLMILHLMGRLSKNADFAILTTVLSYGDSEVFLFPLMHVENDQREF